MSVKDNLHLFPVLFWILNGICLLVESKVVPQSWVGLPLSQIPGVGPSTPELVCVRNQGPIIHRFSAAEFLWISCVTQFMTLLQNRVYSDPLRIKVLGLKSKFEVVILVV